MRVSLLLLIAGIANPVFAQDIDFEFDETELVFELEEIEEIDGGVEFDDAIFETEDPTSLALTARYQFSRSNTSLTTTDISRFDLDLEDAADWGALGNIEWKAQLSTQDKNGTNTLEATLSKFTLQNSYEDVSWKLGKMRIGWGELEGISILDIVNPVAASSGSLSGDPDAGQWALSADYFIGDNTLSGFSIVRPAVSSEIIALASDNTQPEFGLKYQRPSGKGQLSLYAAQLLPQSAVVNLGAGTSSAQPYNLVGVSYNYARSGVLWEFDLGYKSGQERSDLTGLSTHDRFDLGVGFEYALNSTTQINMAAYGQFWLNQKDKYYFPGGFEDKEINSGYQLYFSKSFSNDRWNTIAVFSGALDASVSNQAISIEYSGLDELKLLASADWTQANSESLFSAYDGANGVSFLVQRSF
ncbi:MAG: hypothetical protein HN582_13380 [Marinovum sp.]|nr:hypothetical protein [Marinovum sp.]